MGSPMTRILCALVLALSPAFGAELLGRVIGITDGDTITVLIDRTPLTVRLHGIDAPEKKQPFGTRAKQTASALAFDQTVTVEITDTDRYGRTVGIIHLRDGRILSHELVEAGMAWWYRKYSPKDSVLASLEADAKQAKRGLWSDPNHVPPWEWRKQATKRSDRRLSKSDLSKSDPINGPQF